MRRIAYSLLVLALLLPATSVSAGKRTDRKAKKIEDRRAKADAMAAATMKRLLAAHAGASKLREKATAWAVFNNTKVSLGLTGGGGSGVAVDTKTGARTYMKMATGGINIGLGAQKYQVVFLFADRDTFNRFLDSGWEADSSASAVAGTAGANAEATFRKGVAIFQLTEAGLMLQADLSGTKYWKNKKLND